MRVDNLSMTVMMLFLAAMGGCDEYRNERVSVAGDGPTGLVGDGSEDAAEMTAEKIEDGVEDVDPPSLEVVWTDSAVSEAQGTLSFEVTNTTDDREIAFAVSVVSQGFLGEAEKHLADMVLGAGESASIAFSAADLPVRSEAVMSLMAVGIRLEHEVLADPPRDARLTAQRLYRHAPGLGAVRAYDAKALRAELDGVLFEVTGEFSETTEAALESEVLGEKAVDGEAGEPVSFAASELVVRGSVGDALGVITRVSLGRADTTGEDATVTVEDSADEEMEVDDE